MVKRKYTKGFSNTDRERTITEKNLEIEYLRKKTTILEGKYNWVEMLDELLESAECAHDWFSGCKVDGIDDKEESAVVASEKLRQAIANTKKWQDKIGER